MVGSECFIQTFINRFLTISKKALDDKGFLTAEFHYNLHTWRVKHLLALIMLWVMDFIWKQINDHALEFPSRYVSGSKPVDSRIIFATFCKSLTPAMACAASILYLDLRFIWMFSLGIDWLINRWQLWLKTVKIVLRTLMIDKQKTLSMKNYKQT